MIVIVLLVEVLVFLLLAGVVLTLLRPIFAWLARMAMVLIGAVVLLLAGGLGLALAITSSAAGNTFGIVAGLGVAVALPLIVAVRQWRTPRDEDHPECSANVAELRPAPPPVYAGPAEGKGDRAVTDAWNTLADMVPDDDLARLHAARTHCARILAAADREGMDMELVAVAVLVRQRLPELAKRNAALWAEAEDDERAELSEGILEDLKLIGKRAQIELARGRKAHRDQLFALRKHIAQRTNTLD